MFHDWMHGDSFISGLKGQSRGHKAQNKSMSVFRLNAILPLAAYVSYAGFSPLQCNAVHRVLPASLSHDRCCCRPPFFPCVEFFAVILPQKTLPALVFALLWVPSSSSMIWQLMNRAGWWDGLCMYAAVDGQQGQQSTVLVMTTPGPVAVAVGEVPMSTTCANCQHQIVTNVIYETGGLTWLIFAILCFLGSVRG